LEGSDVSNDIEVDVSDHRIQRVDDLCEEDVDLSAGIEGSKNSACRIKDS